MKILLLVPPYLFNKRLGLSCPLSIGYLATFLLTKGHEVKIIDCDAMNLSVNGLKKYFFEERPEIVGVTATSYSRFAAIELIKAAKAVLPDSYVVAGGPHFTATAEDALKFIKGIDVIVRGEGENTFLDLVEAISKRKDFRDIDGLSFRKGETIIHNRNRQLIEDLNSLPMLKRDLFDDRLYFEKLPHSDMPCKSILASRGCPFSCSFCFPHDRSYRRRSASNILDEVEYLLDRYKIEAIRFFDLTFTVEKKTIIDFCDEIFRRRLKFKWYCESRVDINLALLEIMKEAGCYSIDFGLESASEKVLKMINKNIMPEQALEFAKKCKEIGIKTKVLLMLSLPGEEKEDAQLTYDFSCKMLPYISSLGLEVTRIIPGTELEARARQLGILSKDFSWNLPFSDSKAAQVSETSAVPIYIENLTFDEIKSFVMKYSVFDLYNIKKISFDTVKQKVWNGLTKWNKNFLFKMKWVGLFIRQGFSGLISRCRK